MAATLEENNTTESPRWPVNPFDTVVEDVSHKFVSLRELLEEGQRHLSFCDPKQGDDTSIVTMEDHTSTSSATATADVPAEEPPLPPLTGAARQLQPKESVKSPSSSRRSIKVITSVGDEVVVKDEETEDDDSDDEDATPKASSIKAMDFDDEISEAPKTEVYTTKKNDSGENDKTPSSRKIEWSLVMIFLIIPFVAVLFAMPEETGNVAVDGWVNRAQQQIVMQRQSLESSVHSLSKRFQLEHGKCRLFLQAGMEDTGCLLEATQNMAMDTKESVVAGVTQFQKAYYSGRNRDHVLSVHPNSIESESDSTSMLRNRSEDDIENVDWGESDKDAGESIQEEDMGTVSDSDLMNNDEEVAEETIETPPEESKISDEGNSNSIQTDADSSVVETEEEVVPEGFVDASNVATPTVVDYEEDESLDEGIVTGDEETAIEEEEATLNAIEEDDIMEANIVDSEPMVTEEPQLSDESMEHAEKEEDIPSDEYAYLFEEDDAVTEQDVSMLETLSPVLEDAVSTSTTAPSTSSDYVEVITTSNEKRKKKGNRVKSFLQRFKPKEETNEFEKEQQELQALLSQIKEVEE